MHKKLQHLTHLLEKSTLGNWGPTTAPPRGTDRDEFHLVKDGERGEPSWSAIVSDLDGASGVDHERYAKDDPNHFFYEPGTDVYGGTLIAESIANRYNGQFMVEAHNLMPNLLMLINELEKVAKFSTNPMLTEKIFEHYLGPNE